MRASRETGSNVEFHAPATPIARLMRPRSESIGSCGVGARRSTLAVVGMLVVGSLILPPIGQAQVRLSLDEALRLAFPEPAEIERRTAFLDDEDMAEARRLAGPAATIDHRVISYYVGLEGGEALGVAYFDSHRVRTLPEVLMIVVGPQGEVQRIEILKFAEPPEYELPSGWLQQFDGERLNDDLSLKRRIVNMTGATLSSRAATNAVRRVLALHQVIDPLDTQERAAR